MSDNTQEKNIFIFDAAEGMVLSQDIMTSTGHLIAAKDRYQLQKSLSTMS